MIATMAERKKAPGRGRPRKDFVTMHISVPGDVRDAIIRLSEITGRTMSMEAVFALRAWISQHEDELADNNDS